MKPRVLFINAPYSYIVGIKDSAGHATPLNLCYLASYLRENVDCEISIIDCEIEEMSFEEIGKRIRVFNPSIVGITCPTPVFDYIIKIAGIIKRLNKDCYVVLGGPHPTALPEDSIRYESVDFLVLKEGEKTFKELVELIVEGKTNFEDIDGLAFKRKGKVIINKPREYIKDLDSLPFPARDLLDFKRYRSAPTKRISKYLSTSILTGRGCPYNCIHCISNCLWNRKFRFRSSKNIVEEIEYCIKKFGIREFNFYDDTFTLSEDHVIEVCDEIIRRKLKIAWICFGRVNMITRRMVRKMKQAGCKKISFGLESGSQEILNKMRKEATLDMARKAVKIVNEEGINVNASFMLGNVGETRKTVKKTINFAKSLELDNATFFITTPYPGTDLHKIALEKGYINNKTRYMDFAPITDAKPIVVQDNLSAEELIKLRKKAFAQFYLRPKCILRRIRQIDSLESIKSLVEGVLIFLRVQKTS